MRRLFTTFMIALVAVTVLSSCAREEPPRVIVAQPPEIEVEYQFWTGARHVEIDGEIVNHGPGPAFEVELEFQFFNRFGDWVRTEYRTFPLDLPARTSAPFFADFGISGIDDIEVRIAGVAF